MSSNEDVIVIECPQCSHDTCIDEIMTSIVLEGNSARSQRINKLSCSECGYEKEIPY